MTTTEIPTPLALWLRVLEPDGEPFPPAVARYVLGLNLSDADRERVDALSEKVQGPLVTAEERAELDALLHLASFLSILHSRARVALRTHLPGGGNGTPAH